MRKKGGVVESPRRVITVNSVDVPWARGTEPDKEKKGRTRGLER